MYSLSIDTLRHKLQNHRTLYEPNTNLTAADDYVATHCIDASDILGSNSCKPLKFSSVLYEQKEFGATLSVQPQKGVLFYKLHLRNATCGSRLANGILLQRHKTEILLQLLLDHNEQCFCVLGSQYGVSVHRIQPDGCEWVWTGKKAHL